VVELSSGVSIEDELTITLSQKQALDKVSSRIKLTLGLII
jgi:hypothetical protein